MGLLILVVLAPINLLLRKRPQDVGLQPDGDAAPAPDVAARPASNVVDAAWAAVDWTLGRAMRTARFWWIAFGYFCGLYAWYAVQVHQTKYLIEIGFSPIVAAWALGLVSLVGIPGQVALGHISDRIGREWVWTASSVGFIVCYLALILLREDPSELLLYVMIVAQGALGYGLTSIFGAIVAEIFEGKHYGSIFGTLMLAAIVGGAAGPWVDGRTARCARELHAGLLDRRRIELALDAGGLARRAAQGARGRRPGAPARPPQRLTGARRHSARRRQGPGWASGECRGSAERTYTRRRRKAGARTTRPGAARPPWARARGAAAGPAVAVA